MIETSQCELTAPPRNVLCDCADKMVCMVDQVKAARSMAQLNKAIAEFCSIAMMSSHYFRVRGLSALEFRCKYCFLCGGIVDR